MIAETVDPATGLKFITVSGQVGVDANLEATTFQDQNIFSVRLILPATLWYDDVPFDQSFPGGSANVAWRANIFPILLVINKQLFLSECKVLLILVPNTLELL